MLTSLAVQNVVLIEKLVLDGQGGLLALTGETGAGKSILLDALSLALGMRADASLIRHGQETASVTASFDLAEKHPARLLLKSRDLADNETVILRRILFKDGKSKAFINDAPVTIALLRETGEKLVEIHGQFETQGLLDPASHRRVLDDFAGLQSAAAAVTKNWESWQQAKKALIQAQESIETAKTQEDYLRHVVAELEKLSPRTGEEAALAEKRTMLMNHEKLAEALNRAQAAVGGDGGAEGKISAAHGALSRIADKMPDKIAPALDALAQAHSALADAAAHIDDLTAEMGGDQNLEKIEDRYFAIKDCAKKHRCAPDDLPRLLTDLSEKLALITHQDGALKILADNSEKMKKIFVTAAENLHAKRCAASGKLAKAVMKELPPLKLAQASFIVAVEMLGENDWGAQGMDGVRFKVATNPGQPAGPIDKVASGGELARLMLALKVVLAETSNIPVLVFDEVDSGVGGATADAVGERLSRLGKKCQVLVVTHSPQVAAKADHHWIIAKSGGSTRVTPLSSLKERQEEIARMLSGSDVTKEARAAANKLLECHVAAA